MVGLEISAHEVHGVQAEERRLRVCARMGVENSLQGFRDSLIRVVRASISGPCRVTSRGSRSLKKSLWSTKKPPVNCIVKVKL